MKKVVCFILINILLLSCLCIAAFADNVDIDNDTSVILLRAGGGDGGSSGGGSSSGSSSSKGGYSHYSDTSGQPTLFESVIQFIIMPFVLFSSSILFYIKLAKRSLQSKKLMKQMMQKDSAWKFNNISSTVKDSFYAIQTAWSNMDMTSASEYMSDELFDRFQTKLNWMEYRNQKNILKNKTKGTA